jgi:hypothetical protein
MHDAGWLRFVFANESAEHICRCRGAFERHWWSDVVSGPISKVESHALTLTLSRFAVEGTRTVRFSDPVPLIEGASRYFPCPCGFQSPNSFWASASWAGLMARTVASRPLMALSWSAPAGSVPAARLSQR